jgi:hypothetical protein
VILWRSRYTEDLQASKHVRHSQSLPEVTPLLCALPPHPQFMPRRLCERASVLVFASADAEVHRGAPPPPAGVAWQVFVRKGSQLQHTEGPSSSIMEMQEAQWRARSRLDARHHRLASRSLRRAASELSRWSAQSDPIALCPPPSGAATPACVCAPTASYY